MAVYDSINEAYDLVYTDVHKKVPFVVDILRKYQAQEILELGCGSGLFTIPLKQQGLSIEGLEISPEMIKVTQKKEPELKLHQGDMRSYHLQKTFDAILILSSTLVLLQNHEEINQCLQRSYEQLKPGGLFFLELPNHPVEIRNSDSTQEVHSNEDHSIIVVIQSLKAEKYWREYWFVFRKTGAGFQKDEITCDEFLYSPNLLVEALQKTGFEIKETYGDLFGNPFDENSSWRRVLICQKI
ncbi:class I SAM-dependent methyltransferase [Lyngbya sp. PCC 8106]|uniref:class I SAM-dependent DNA methyltransferase n=1 Tax=Lyngbya sp. (strain PCC 8106) TaxID=313612 RepID=UPI0000EA8AD6|nr:class I SAM-dependent methyltransferase [Lyngbya sp. PCC 8106]EAW37237.1 putative methyltransferase [Lyngbya sp. PCC 8106]